MEYCTIISHLFRTSDLGHMILLGENPAQLAHIGLDDTIDFGVSVKGGVADHSAGYLNRLITLEYNTAQFPISIDGYSNHSFCCEFVECHSMKSGEDTLSTFSRYIGTECTDDEECYSGRCDSGKCRSKNELVMLSKSIVWFQWVD